MAASFYWWGKPECLEKTTTFDRYKIWMSKTEVRMLTKMGQLEGWQDGKTMNVKGST